MKENAMTTKLGETSADIILHIDEEAISMTNFRKATDHFFSLIKEISKAVYQDANPNDWVVKVYKGSVRIGVMPTSMKIDQSIIHNTMIEGWKLLSDGKEPPLFSDKAIEDSKELASLTKEQKKSNLNISVELGDTQFKVKSDIALGVKNLLSCYYEEDGSVDGTLEKVDVHDKSEFTIYDALDKSSIKCTFPDHLLNEALESFAKRVEVLGKVKYKKEGVTVSVKANAIIRYPNKSEVPTLDDIRSILRGS